MHVKNILALNKIFEWLLGEIVEDYLTFDEAKGLHEDTFKSQLKIQAAAATLHHHTYPCHASHLVLSSFPLQHLQKPIWHLCSIHVYIMLHTHVFFVGSCVVL